ncbi:hypothetical protein ACFFQF_30455 [Haladaptatus pallidirubidus]|uniref:hypothetical protein n=1 Tax=Haladaptatus pallidirubidus TaxID=1008152 RepID=UPI0035EBA373
MVVANFLTNPGGQNMYQSLVTGDAPFYLEGWFALVILFVWLLLPVSLGYLRFRSVDLS